MKMDILYKNCDVAVHNTKALPRDSYIVSYLDNEILTYDIARGTMVELFDYYYDNFRNVKGIAWTKGTVNPKSYDYTPKENKKKR